ncbi:MAG: DNA recombination protein RmuC, partial [Chitinophagales bacterium]
MEIIYLLIGIIAGFAIGYLLLRNQSSARISELFSQKNVAEEKVKTLLENTRKLESESNERQQKILELTSENSSAKISLVNLQDKLNDQKQELEEMQTRMKIEFRNLANDLLDEKSKKFTEQNQSNLNEILKPLSEKIREFEKKVEDSHKESLEKNAGLKQQMEDLQKLNQTIGQEAKNLTLALKGQTKTQGNWGERILESILEVSGLEKNREYFIQENLLNDEGRRFIPDVVIRLPDDKTLVIDSKVSITAYESYCSCNDALLQRRSLADHVSSVKNHMKNLNTKQYQQLYELKSLDFVLMFIPIDAAYTLVAQEDQTLWVQAYEKNILIVTPLSILPALRTISNLWRQEKQARNSLDIARQAGELYDKFDSLWNDLQAVKSRMLSAQTAFDDSIRKLRGN